MNGKPNGCQRSRIWIALVLAGATCAAYAQAAEKAKPRIAVLDFKALNGITPGEASVIFKRFESSLVQQQNYQLVTRDEIKRLMDERKLQEYLDSTGVSEALSFGKAAQVDRVAIGSVGKFGQLFYMNIQLLNVETSEIEKTVDKEHKGSLEELLGVVSELAIEIAAADRVALVLEKSQSQQGENFTQDLGGGVQLEMIWIPGGKFKMGSDIELDTIESKYGGKASYFADELPAHVVEVQGFWIGKYEVTIEQYLRFHENHSIQSFKGEDLGDYRQPVVSVTWEDAKGFCDWLRQNTGFLFDLPTEAQWEYACRAGTAKPFYWGFDVNVLGEYANFADASTLDYGWNWTARDLDDKFKVSAPVGSFKPNPWGLHDMLGNVQEWCIDFYSNEFYAKSPRRNPVFLDESKKQRVVRGGSWETAPAYCRVSTRDRKNTNYHRYSIGFRVVRNL